MPRGAPPPRVSASLTCGAGSWRSLSAAGWRSRRRWAGPRGARARHTARRGAASAAGRGPRSGPAHPRSPTASQTVIAKASPERPPATLERARHLLPQPHLDAQLLAHLAVQRLLGRLARVDLAAGELPAARRAPAARSAGRPAAASGASRSSTTAAPTTSRSGDRVVFRACVSLLLISAARRCSDRSSR